jgi:hypothetical protein
VRCGQSYIFRHPDVLFLLLLWFSFGVPFVSFSAGLFMNIAKNAFSTLVYAAAVAIIGTFPAMAASSAMRPATKAEIVKHLGPHAAGTVKPNGFTYKAGSSKGYKVTDGQICIRSPEGSTRCASIVTNGTTFQMIAADGARSNF